MEFFATREMSVTWMRTFVTLVPKKHDAAKSSHYRSISICTILYKIYAKLMVKTMKPILSCLIYPKKGAFIGGWSITNNVMIPRSSCMIFGGS